MTYETAKISMSALMRPAFDAGVALTRLDERIARSPVGQGWIERTHFADACASLWIDGELVHLEDLVLHDATRDIRTPTHELTIARDVLRTRRRVAGQSPDWALSADGIRSLRKTAEITFADADDAQTRPALSGARSLAIRKGRGKTPTTSNISPASTTPPSMPCSPDRKRRSQTQPVPAAAAGPKKIR